MVYLVSKPEFIPVQFHTDFFTSRGTNSFGLSYDSIDSDFYRSLFQSFQLSAVGFGRKYFNGPDTNWLNWTFQTNDEEMTIYSSNFRSFEHHHPTFVLDFTTRSPLYVIDYLFDRLPEAEQKRFATFIDATTIERSFIEILFVNFLFSSFLYKTKEIFLSISPVSSVHFERRTEQFLALSVRFNHFESNKPELMLLFKNGSISLPPDAPSTLPFVLQKAEALFLNLLRSTGLNVDVENGKLFAEKLFNAHLFDSVHSLYLNSGEYRLRSLFVSDL